MNNKMPAATKPTLWLALFLIVLFGAYLRLYASLNTTVYAPIRSDAQDYFSYAYNLQHYGIYSRSPTFLEEAAVAPSPDAVRSPGYPLLLWWFAAEAPTASTVLQITLLQALIGVLMLPLVFWLGRQLMPPAWALLPTLLVAISPQLIVAGTYVLTETLFTFLLLLASVCLYWQVRTPARLWLALGSGLLLAMATLTRPTLQYFLLVLLPLLWCLVPRALRLRHSLLLVLGFMLAYGPWLVRNHLSVDNNTDPSLTIGTVVHGHYPNMMYNNDPASWGVPYQFDPQAEHMSASMSAALRGIAERVQAAPLEYLRWYLVGKPIAFLSWNDPAATNEIFTYPVTATPYNDMSSFMVTKTFMKLSHPLWMLLAVATALVIVVTAVKRRKREQTLTQPQLLQWLIVGMFGYFIALHFIALPLPRYCTPLFPLLFLLGCSGLAQLQASVKHQFFTQRPL